MSRFKYLLLFTMISFTFAMGVACDENEDGDEELPAVDCETVEVPRYSEMAEVWNNCVGCHSSMFSGSARQDAPAEFDYDSYEAALFDPVETVEVVLEGEMPPTGELSAEAKEMLNVWAQCGTPE
ncbi:MAG: hypothetical protein H6713_35270 [Myxococcales bacterium]|nr:hypothetical protein [Myxococcales bacterium]